MLTFMNVLLFSSGESSLKSDNHLSGLEYDANITLNRMAAAEKKRNSCTRSPECEGLETANLSQRLEIKQWTAEGDLCER